MIWVPSAIPAVLFRNFVAFCNNLGVRWQSAATTPLFGGGRTFQSGGALRFPPHSIPFCRVGCVLLCAGWLAAGGWTARAYVYATNLRLNGSTNPVTIPVGGNLQISYVLNEAATVGALIEVFAGTNVVRALPISPGNPGTLRGLNGVVWDGKDNWGSNVVLGTYSVRVTVAAQGYGAWTQISDDADPGTYAYEPRGIAVNRNPTSPFYGRVYVANAREGPDPVNNPGDRVGILKFNADASPASEGSFSNGGYPWAGDGFSPWKLEVAGDDFVYVNDWRGKGIVLRFDPWIASNSMVTVLRGDFGPTSPSADNNPTGAANLAGPFVTGTGASTHIWMADINYTKPAGTGISRWGVTGDGTCVTNDLGTRIILARSTSDLNGSPYDVAVDQTGRIYVVQYRFYDSATEATLLRFPPYAGLPMSRADWKVGQGVSTLKGALGVAVDSAASMVAVAFGLFTPVTGGSGGIGLFNAANGQLITRSLAPLHDCTDVAWDHVGNLYVLDNSDSRWRVYSPPGANAATTVALSTVEVSAVPPSPPVLIAPAYAAGQFQFRLLGQDGVSYLIWASTNLQTWVAVATNTAPGTNRLVTLPAPAGHCCYRAQVAP